MRRYTSLAFQGDPNGDWVKRSDYLALQSALREALDGWDAHATFGPLQFDKHLERIAALRAKFLES